jgi:hypothetical protein
MFRELFVVLDAILEPPLADDLALVRASANSGANYNVVLPSALYPVEVYM